MCAKVEIFMQKRDSPTPKHQ